MTYPAFASLLRTAPLLAFTALVCTAGLFLAQPAAAQSDTDPGALAERMNRLETELNQLQRQVNRGSSTPSGAPAQGGAPAYSGGTGPQGLADLAARMDQFDERLADLTGRIEEIDHQNKLLSSRLDKLGTDVDFRFRALEKGGAPQSGLAANPPPGAQPNQPPGAPGQAGSLPPVQPMPGGNDGSTLGKPPSVLGTLRSDTPVPDQQQAAVAPPPAAPAPVRLPPGSVQSQYNFATDLLHQGDYAGAEQALTQFIAQHPNDPLASSAQYWLGETFFVRKSYDRAAKAFLAGYQKYPKTQKAPDDLLKLAMSLTALNQKKEACAVFRQLSSEYPNADSRIKQNAAREKSRAGCT